MATISELDRIGAVHRLDPGLPPRTQEFRCIYVSPRLRDRLNGDLVTLASAEGVQLSPIEQLAVRVEQFCEGSPLIYWEHFHELFHVRDMVWELKTADLRMFGFFHKRDVFVAVTCDCATRIKRHNLYHGYCNEVAQFCDALDLDEPKCILGDDPNDVVSAVRFAAP